MTFLGRSEVVPIRTQHVPQSIETPVTFAAVPNAYVRFAYARSSDSMSSQGEGQDYLCFKHNDQRLVFVVCDGVGSSFCGNLAARILGEALLEWLWSLDIGYLGGAAALTEAATSHLNKIQKHAQHEVAEYQIPDGISGLVRQALEGQRAYGSEAIFAAARIDYPGPVITEGLCSVIWMGDTQIHVLGEDGKAFDLGGQWNNANRWSTTQGVKGQMAAWMRELQGIGRIAAFTDGLSAHATNVLEYGDSKLDREIHAGSRLATSDDVAFIDMVIRSPIYEGMPDPELPDPNAEHPRLEQIWNPTGADTYELRWNWSGSNKDSFLIEEASNPALSNARIIEIAPGTTSWKPPSPQPPGHYYYRVRAIKRHGAMTPWSELRLTKVAYPPPPAPVLSPVEPGKTPTLVWSSVGETIDYTLERAVDPSFENPEIVYSGRGTSWTVPISGARPGIYHYRVRAVSDGGPGPWSEIQQVEIQAPPPPRPHLGNPSYGHTHGSFELRWQPVPGAARYELQQAEAEREEEITFETSDSIYSVSDQPVGRYTYRVRACNEYTCSEWSNEQVIVVAPQAPDEAPELTLEGPDETGTVRLTWTAVPDASEYVVEMSEDEDFRNARVLTQSGQSMELVRREPGSLHVRVSGANTGGEGPWSNVSSVALAPNTPGWIEANASDLGRLYISWGAVGGRSQYCLEVEAQSDVTTTRQEIYRGEDTQFEMAVPAMVNSVTFRVRAELPGVESDWLTSDPVRLQSALQAPQLDALSVDDKSNVHLRWNAVDGATSYILEASRNEAFTDVRASAPIAESEILFHAPTSGKFWFRVKAAHKTGTSQPSNTVSAQVRRPSPPTLWPLDPVKANTPFEISWKGMPGCVFYELQESPDSSFEASRTHAQRVFHPAQKLVIPGRPAGRLYFRVRAVDEQNEASVWSDVLAIDIL